jgi:hypothetical protein
MRKPIGKAVIASICALGCTLYAAWAQDMPKAGKVYKEVKCDLNFDGKSERIGLIAYAPHKESDSFWGQLTVWDGAGKQLWQGPKVKDQRGAFAFGSWPFGASTIDWIGDLDGDKQVDLISALPQSDVRPPTYNRYKWDGKQFLSQGPMMLLESPTGSQNFQWTKAYQWDGEKPLTWVMAISGSPTSPVIDVTSYRGACKYASGQASIQCDSKGVTVKKWLKKMSSSS